MSPELPTSSLFILLPLVFHDALDHLSESPVPGVAFGEALRIVGFFGSEFSPALETPRIEHAPIDRRPYGATGLGLVSAIVEPARLDQGSDVGKHLFEACPDFGQR